MNDWDSLRPIDILVWLSTVLTQQNVTIGEILIELNKENIEINNANLGINTKILKGSNETLDCLKNIEKSLLTLIEKLDEKNG